MSEVIHWTEEEDKIICECYPSGGSRECSKFLKSRSTEAIRKRAMVLGIVRERYRWSNEEDDFLREHYLEYGSAKCAEYLTNRNQDSIRARAAKLGIFTPRKTSSPVPWTKEEDALLKKTFYSCTYSKMCELLPNHNENSIFYRAKKLGLNKECIEWSNEEEEILKENFKSSKESVEKCMELLPGRTVPAIRLHAKKLGLTQKKPKNVNKWRTWTTKEDEKLLKLYKEYNGHISRFEKFFADRTYSAIHCRLNTLGVEKGVHESAWTKEELEKLRDVIAKVGYSTKHSSAFLDAFPTRTITECLKKAKECEFKYIYSKKTTWTAEEDKIILTRYPIGGSRACQQVLPNRSRDSIYRRAFKIGVKYDRDLPF